MLTKDPVTGKIGGGMADVMQAVADKLSLKLEWAEEVGWGQFVESLNNDRFDAFCAGLWRNAERGRYIGYTVPLFYSAVFPYVRPGDDRFTDLKSANRPDIKLSAMDGEMSDLIAKHDFPKASVVSVPQLGDINQILMNVAQGKADIVFNEPGFVQGFLDKNPGKLVRASHVPYRVFPTSIAVRLDQHDLRLMLDSAFVELMNTGVINRILDSYNPSPDIFLRVAKPYAGID